MSMEELQPAKTAWEGRVGDTFLRVDIMASGRIASSFRTKGGNDRRVVVDTIEQLERSVLFQVMLTAPAADAGKPAEISKAVDEARIGLPDPTAAAPRPKKKRRAPRRQGPRPRRR